MTIGAVGAAVGDKAATIVPAVSGEEILESIVNSTEGGATGAIGATSEYLAQDIAKAAAVSGGIAL